METQEQIKIENLPAEVQQAVKESGLEHTKVQGYIGKFFPYLTKLSELEEKIKTINSENPTQEDGKLARELRLIYVKNRTSSEKEKDALKKNILLEGNLIQSMYNVVLNASKIKENHLEAIEKHQENIEKEKKALLKAEREALLSPYVENVSLYPLGELGQPEFESLLEGSKLIKEKKEKDAQIETLRIKRENKLRKYTNEIPEGLGTMLADDFCAKYNYHQQIFEQKEKDRLAEEKRIREENAQLRAAQEEKEKKFKIAKERQASLLAINVNIPFEQIEEMKDEAFGDFYLLEKNKYEKLKKEQEKEFNENLLKSKKAEKEKADLEAKIKAQEEKVKQERIKKVSLYEIDLSPSEWQAIYKMPDEGFSNYINVLQKGKEKQEADLKAEQEAAKGDKLKITDLCNDLEALKTKYAFKSKKHQKLYASVNKSLSDLISNINTHK